MNRAGRSKNVASAATDEYRLKLDQFLHDEITAATLLTEEDQQHADLQEAVVALARRNIKQRKV